MQYSDEKMTDLVFVMKTQQYGKLHQHRRAVDMSQAGSIHPARSARSKFEAPSGGDFYPEEKRQRHSFLAAKLRPTLVSIGSK